MNHQTPNNQQMQFNSKNMKSPSGDVTFIAPSEMFHESSSSDDDHRVKAWREMWLETYTYMEACVDL